MGFSKSEKRSKLGILLSKKKRGNDYHVKCGSPVDIDGWCKAKLP